jgi:hypothetical protein
MRVRERIVFMARVVCLAAVGLSLACASVAQKAVSPAELLGRPVGVDFQLADWREVSGYFAKLAADSPRVDIAKVGMTTEGRDFLLATISSERNLARLDEIKRNAALIADPRGLTEEQRQHALDGCVPIVMISNAMHSTETAAPQFAMELAWKLATSDEEPYASAREKLVVLILPCTNPDGLDHVVDWYRKTVGTPYEGSGLTKLYQLYAGHDNNRDWFMLTQAETRIVTELLYSTWHPHVYWDVHQQGSNAERMFVPPFRDPLDPNLDPAVMAGIGLLGTRAVLDMTREGLSGVATGVTFDQWWNGGNRNVPVRHNIIGLLTEAASVNVASPIFLKPSDLKAPGGKGSYAPSVNFLMPWPGGWWRLRNIIDYEQGFARSLLRSLAAEPRVWLASAMSAAQRAIDKGATDTPRAWVIPSDNSDRGAVRRLVDTLLCGGVEIHVAHDKLNVDGREYPAGSLVIRRDQPYGQHVADLFEVQHYPDGDPPYDVAGWTLPALLGVQRVEAMHPVQGELARVRTAAESVEKFASGAGADALSSADSDSWSAVFAKLGKGESLTWLAPNGVFAAGAKDVAHSENRVLHALPRVGLYSPWSGSNDEGWMRWLFDTAKLPYVTVRNEMLRPGKLRSVIDVLILPDVSSSTLDQGRAPGSAPDEFTGGLDPEGSIAIEEFVRDGGTLITIGDASAWAIKLFELPLSQSTKEKDMADFSCPGSVLRAIPESSWLTAGLPSSLALFFSGNTAWKVTDSKPGDHSITTLLRYAPTEVLISGWIRKPEAIADKAAWVRAEHGRGAIHLFAFSPHYRGWSQDTFQLLFRAILLDGILPDGTSLGRPK